MLLITANPTACDVDNLIWVDSLIKSWKEKISYPGWYRYIKPFSDYLIFPILHQQSKDLHSITSQHLSQVNIS